MKKIIITLMVAMMTCSLVACDKKDAATTADTTNTVEDTTADTTEVVDDTQEAGSTAGTIGEVLGATFKEQLAADSSLGAQALADALIKTQEGYTGFGSMPVEEGLLTGFSNTEIKGFKEGVMFSPMIGTIPFVGYVFILDEGADVEAFKTMLKDNAVMNWNICTEAEEMYIESVDNKVLFAMCPGAWDTP